MTVWVAALLGLVQGVFMFVPVSSTSHLALTQHWLEGQGHLTATPESPEMLLLDLVLHSGTVVSIAVVFRGQIMALGRDFRAERRARRVDPADPAPASQMIAMLGVATVATGVLGLGVRVIAGGVFGDPRVIALLLVITGGILWWVDSTQPRGVVQITAWIAIGVGLVQALALLPGLSRSGLTIAAAMALGMLREPAARFSFFLAIPTILAATFVQAAEVVRLGEPVDLPIPSLLVGFVVAAVVGALALALVLKLLYAGKFRFFSIYVWLLAAAVLVIGDAATGGA